MADKRWLVRRKDTWFVRKRVPAEAQHILGPEIVRTTKCHTLADAVRARHAILADIERTISAARKSKDAGSPLWIIAEAKRVARVLSEPGAMDQLDEESFNPVDELIDKLTALREFKRDPETGRPIIPDQPTEDAITTAARVLNADPDSSLFSHVKEIFLREKEPHINKQTLNAKRKHLEDFEGWHKDGPLEGITRRVAGRYVEEKLLTRGDAPKTTRDTLSNLGSFFVWAMARGYVDSNPFQGMGATIRESSRGGQKWTRRAWTSAELKALLSKLDKSDPMQARLFALTAIGMFTGMRLNEICETEIVNVHDDRIHIPAGKTDSAVRDVPIHPALKMFIKRLKKESTDGYLISGLERGGEDDKRSHYASKRFGAIKRRLGVSDVVDGRDRIDFHALRKTLNSALRAEGVATDVREAIVGHKPKGGVNEEVYLDPVAFRVLAAAVKKVSYGKEVEKLIS